MDIRVNEKIRKEKVNSGIYVDKFTFVKSRNAREGKSRVVNGYIIPFSRRGKGAKQEVS